MYKLCLYKPLIANYSEIHGIFFLYWGKTEFFLPEYSNVYYLMYYEP
jgi:hypothetical protein